MNNDKAILAADIRQLKNDNKQLTNMVNEIHTALEECCDFVELFNIKTDDVYAKKAANIAIESAFKRNMIPKHVSVVTEEDKRNFIQKIIDWIMEKLRAFKDFILRKRKEAKAEKIASTISNVVKEKSFNREKAIEGLDVNFALLMNKDGKLITDFGEMINGETQGHIKYSSRFNKVFRDIINPFIIGLATIPDENVREYILDALDSHENAMKEILKTDSVNKLESNGMQLHKCDCIVLNPLVIDPKTFRVHFLRELIGHNVSIKLDTFCPELRNYMTNESYRREINTKLVDSLSEYEHKKNIVLARSRDSERICDESTDSLNKSMDRIRKFIVTANEDSQAIMMFLATVTKFLLNAILYEYEIVDRINVLAANIIKFE